MFKFSTTQMQALDDASHALHRQQLVEDLFEFAPRLCEVAGQPAVESLVDCGLEKAEAHQLTLRGSIRFYLELMAAFGWRFDEDPQYQNLVRHLPLVEIEEEARVGLMYHSYSAYFDRTCGERNQLLVAALKRLIQLDLDSIASSLEHLPAQAMQLLTSVYPEKARSIGPEALQETVNGAIDGAMQLGATDRLSQCTYIVLSYFIGIGFYDDPLYAWISRDAAEKEGELFVASLRRKAMIYAKAVIDYWENI